MRISETDWDEFIETFRSDLERVDDMWKDCERPYRNWDGDIIDYNEYNKLNIWRTSNIVNHVIDYEKSVFNDGSESFEEFCEMWVDDSWEWDDYGELDPSIYDQTDAHLYLISILLSGINDDDPDTDGIKPHVLERFASFKAACVA